LTNPLICISRTTGAGGEDVGRIVSDRLGFIYLDEEIVVRAAEKEGVDPEEIADVERRKSLARRIVDEVKKSVSWDAYAALGGVATPPPTDWSKRYRELIREVIVETAEEGNAVIVAHAAALVLGGRDQVLRVLVTASEDTRARRLAEANRVDADPAGEQVKADDVDRADYVKRFYGVERELPTHYDMVLNTDHFTFEQAAGLVLDGARDLAGSARAAAR